MQKRRQSGENDKISFAKLIAAALLLGLLWLAIEYGAINVMAETIVCQLNPES
jgi:hypothetical protein